MNPGSIGLALRLPLPVSAPCLTVLANETAHPLSSTAPFHRAAWGAPARGETVVTAICDEIASGPARRPCAPRYRRADTSRAAMASVPGGSDASHRLDVQGVRSLGNCGAPLGGVCGTPIAFDPGFRGQLRAAVDPIFIGSIEVLSQVSQSSLSPVQTSHRRSPPQTRHLTTKKPRSQVSIPRQSRGL